MNRRTFTKFMGSAVIGTIVALQLPETIAPVKEAVTWTRESFPVWGSVDTGSATPITYSMIEKAYQRAITFERAEPQVIICNQYFADLYRWKYMGNWNSGFNLVARRIKRLFRF